MEVLFLHALDDMLAFPLLDADDISDFKKFNGFPAIFGKQHALKIFNPCIMVVLLS